jgi:hypothetical protein
MDRKAAIRSYKETPRPMGVWRIRNLRSDKCLIGTSVDLPAMLNRTRAQLRFGGHPNKELQADWNALGDAAFAFEVLDELAVPQNAPEAPPPPDPSEELKVLEALWLERLTPWGERGYHAIPDWAR